MDILATLIADAQASVLIEPSKGAFDHPTMATQSVTRLHSTPSNPGLDSSPLQSLTQSPRVVALVGMQFGWPATGVSQLTRQRRNGIDYYFGLGDFVDVGRGGVDGQGYALGVDHQMAFRARFAAIRGIRAGARAPFGAGTLEASTEARDPSILSACCKRTSKTCKSWSQTPAACHSGSRRQQVMPLPQFISLGSISHGIPVRKTNRIPVNTDRLPLRGRPPAGLGFSAGSRGAMASHNSSLTNGFGMTQSCQNFRFC